MTHKPILRQIVEKWFCLHEYKTIERIDIKNRFGEIESTTILRECVKCGRDKTIKL